jgi:para-aminobenzoate synthetase/4-amino-4-deoxychorismate lyase
MTPLPRAYRERADASVHSLLFETSQPLGKDGRSYLFVEPQEFLAARSLEDLPVLFGRIDAWRREGLHVAGFLTYECGYAFEARLRPLFRPPRGLPLAWFGAYAAPLIFDHRTGEGGLPDLVRPPAEGFSLGAFRLDTTHEEYAEKVARIRELIARGDTYQVNLTSRLLFEHGGSATSLFAALTARQKVAYAAFVHLPEAKILSFSPELFFRLDGGRIETRPMKGTAPRGLDAAEDARLRAWLRTDPKNRSENVMIVDLLRNDLAKVSAVGSVRTESVFEVEPYETLFQMTSTVRGDLLPETSVASLLAALFPSGSITGAPKLRTMEIIRELEGTPRGIYTGALGFLTPSGEGTFSVAIRTMVLDESGRGEMGVGSGIVYDSEAPREYEECLLKARFLTDAAAPIELFETLLFEDGYFLLDHHLDRLRAAAAHFGFPFDEPGARRALEAHASALAPGEAFRVRLVLGPDGGTTLMSAVLDDEGEDGTVCLAAERVHSGNPLLGFKTTKRELFARLYEEARAAGHVDAILLNERGEVTEATRSNVFVRMGGKLLTPPLGSGLLPGVLRRHLLETEPGAEERVLTPRDLIAAEGVFLGNSVRGLRQVVLVGERLGVS